MAMATLQPLTSFQKCKHSSVRTSECFQFQFDSNRLMFSLTTSFKICIYSRPSHWPETLFKMRRLTMPCVVSCSRMDCLCLDGSLGNKAVFRLSDMSTAPGYSINKHSTLKVLDSVSCLVQHRLSGLAKRLPYIIMNPPP